MNDLKLNAQSLAFVTSSLSKLADSGDTYRISVKKWRERRSLSQNSLLHKWCGELSSYLIASGRKDSSPEFCKDLLKHSFLGYEQKTMTDCTTGEKTVISSLRHTSELDTGEMYHFMCLVDRWCVSIGLMLTIPESSEYQQLKGKENES